VALQGAIGYNRVTVGNTDLKNCRAVFFDAGGTLFKPNPSVGEIYARTAQKYGMKVAAGETEKIFRDEFSRRDKLAASQAHATEKNEKEWWKNLVRDVFEGLTPLKNFDSFFEDLYDLFARAEAWKLYPEVPKVLKRLKEKKLILGIISNWDSRLLSICEGMQMEKYFDFILASALVGSAKPDRGIFLEALKRASVKPEEAVHIGDSVENDYEGAKHAGIKAFVINRDGREIKNVQTLGSLADILTLIL